MILSEALQKNGYAVSFGELVSFHDVPCMPGVRFWASTQIQLKFWTPKYGRTPVPQWKLSSTKRWPWSFRGSCCGRAPEPLLLDTAQCCVKKQGSLFLRPFCWTVQFWHRKVKIGLKMVGSSNTISNCPISWLWVNRICIRKTSLVQEPCHAGTKQPTSALVFARAGTLHHVSPFAAPSDKLRVVDFVGSCFFFGVCIFSQPRNDPFVIISYRILISPIFTN